MKLIKNEVNIENIEIHNKTSEEKYGSTWNINLHDSSIDTQKNK